MYIITVITKGIPMLQIKDTDAILNGLNYHLTPDQAHAVEKQLKALAVPAEPWAFSQMTEAAACETLRKAGYTTQSPIQIDAAKQAQTRHAINARDATAIHTIECPNCQQQFLPEQLHLNPERRKRKICIKCLETEGHELAQELRDIKASATGQDVAKAAKVVTDRDRWQRRATETAEKCVKLESDVVNLRQRLLMARDPASELNINTALESKDTAAKDASER